MHAHLGGTPRQVDLAAEKALAFVLQDAVATRTVSSAHDVSDGGLGAALAESPIRQGVGAEVDVPGTPGVALFA